MGIARDNCHIFLEAICKVFRAHDEAELKRLVQWQRQASIVAYLKAGTFIQPYHTSHFDIPTACLYGWLLLSRPYWGFKLRFISRLPKLELDRMLPKMLFTVHPNNYNGLLRFYLRHFSGNSTELLQ